MAILHTVHIHQQPETDSGTKFFYGYVIVIAALIISIVMWGTRHSFGIFFEPVLAQFGWSRAMTSGGFSLAWIITGLVSIGIGKMNDHYGPRLVLSACGVLLSAGYLLMATMNELWQMYLYTLIICIGMSGALIPLMSTVARWFVRKRAFMSGIVLASTGLAMMFLLPASNRIVVIYGWRNGYLFLGILCFICIVTGAQFLKKEPARMGLLPDGDTPTADVPSPTVRGMSIYDAFRTRQLYLLAGVYFCTYFLYYVFSSHIIIHAIDQGFSADHAVLVISVLGAGGIGGRILMGIVADKKTGRFAMIVSGVIMALSLFWMLFAGELWMLFVFGLVFGFGHGGLATLESIRVADLFGMKSHGTLLGFVFFCDTIGGAVSPVLAGYIYDVMLDYSLAFQICAVMGILNLILILLITPVSHHSTEIKELINATGQ